MTVSQNTFYFVSWNPACRSGKDSHEKSSLQFTFAWRMWTIPVRHFQQAPATSPALGKGWTDRHTDRQAALGGGTCSSYRLLNC